MSKRIITLGKWENKPIEWIVLKEEESCQLLITKTKIGRKYTFNNRNNSRWDISDIRIFLNDEFFNNAFNSDEKKMVINAYLELPNQTKDNVFILSFDEAKSLIGSDDEYGCNKQCSENWCCWYRSSYSSTEVYIGYPNICSCHPNANRTFALRPAMWIRK